MKSVDEASVVVIGLGLIGSGALRHLAGEASDPVVGIGPGEPPVFARHEGAFASHYDAGRITRHLDPRLEWAVLAARSIAGYGDLEAASGRAFHRPVGAVMTERDAARVARTLTNAALMHVPVRVVAPGAPSPFAGLLAFPPDATLLCEPGPAGHIDPRAMLGANLRVAVNAGAAVIDDEVVSLVPLAGGVGAARWLVHTRTGPSLRADRVLIAAGPHADEFLDELGPRLEVSSLPQLRVRGETVVLATLDAAEHERLRDLPAVLARMEHPTYDDLYLVPPTVYPDGSVRLKLGATRSVHLDLPTPAAKRSWMRGDDHRSELPELRALLEDLVPRLRATEWATKPCLITETPSGLPSIVTLAPGLVLAAGGNGYAAKSANAIGQLAGDLLLAGTWPDAELGSAAFGG